MRDLPPILALPAAVPLSVCCLTVTFLGQFHHSYPTIPPSRVCQGGHNALIGSRGLVGVLVAPCGFWSHGVGCKCSGTCDT
ncbi:hypothetical protein QBC43DRAFT_323309 [Cladorrhinum sp. PSN259]|nr:hypothetical protein QBC43DRAFT_323309 [Cladorrhinum sp. PSN259]